MDTKTVKLSKKAMRDLKKVPRHVAQKLMAWSSSVSDDGLSEIRKCLGYHDEPLKGNRVGQRSIRLSRAYRAIYRIDETGAVCFVEIIEVNKHEY